MKDGAMKNRLRLVLFFVSFTVLTFGGVIGIEAAILGAHERLRAALARTQELEMLLRAYETSEMWQGAIERRADALHLRDAPAIQGAVLISELKRIADGERLTIVAVRREPSPLPQARAASAYDAYDITIEGPYRGTLSALAELSRASLVTKVKAASLERIVAASSQTGVRTSLQLEVFRMSLDGPSHRS